MQGLTGGVMKKDKEVGLKCKICGSDLELCVR